MTFIHELAVIEDGATVGPGTRIWRFTHVRGSASVGSDCLIGGYVYIDADVSIGDRVKVENHAKIFSPALIEDGVFIGPGACLTNDLQPRAVMPDGRPKGPEDWIAQGVRVESGASIGAMAVVLPGVRIGNWAMVGAGAVVTRDVPAHALVLGNPARAAGWVCACGQKLDSALTCPSGHNHKQSGTGLVVA